MALIERVHGNITRNKWNMQGLSFLFFMFFVKEPRMNNSKNKLILGTLRTLLFF